MERHQTISNQEEAMRFYRGTHRHYCGIDLHARTMYVCILSQEGAVLLHRNLPCNPGIFLAAIDGGITRDNIDEVGQWGADLVISGSAIFERGAIAENAGAMLNALRRS